MIKVSDGRGKHMISVKNKNMERVIAWFKENPESTAMEASKGLGLSYVSVRSHLKKIKNME